MSLRTWLAKWFGPEPTTPTVTAEDQWPAFTGDGYIVGEARWPQPGFQETLSDLPVDTERTVGTIIERHGIKYQVTRVITQRSVAAIAIEIGTGNDATGVSW